MAVTVKGRTIVMTAQNDSYPDWVKIKECRWNGASDDAVLLAEDLDGARIMQSQADQAEFIDVVRPNLWYRGIKLTTLSGTTQGQVTFYTE